MLKENKVDPNGNTDSRFKFVGLDFMEKYHIRFSSIPFVHNGDIIGYPFNLGDIIDNGFSAVIPDKLGVYHLFSDDVLVYIGMSTNIRARLTGHYKKRDIEFNNVLWFCASMMNMDLKDVFQVEKLMIQHHRPVYNQAYLNCY